MSDLVRTTPPVPLTDGNRESPPKRLTFAETLDLPERSGPWKDDFPEGPEQGGHDQLFDHFRSLNFWNMLGYARATTGDDPTPSKEYRHLILLETDDDCRLHIQISQRNLAALNFEKIKLVGGLRLIATR